MLPSVKQQEACAEVREGSIGGFASAPRRCALSSRLAAKSRRRVEIGDGFQKGGHDTQPGATVARSGVSFGMQNLQAD